MATILEATRQAEKLEAERRYVEAGALWERLRQPERAIAAYKRGGKGDRAALLLEQGGQLKDAAALYMALGQFARAGRLYEAQFAYGEAARAYLRANEREHAALMCEKAESFEDAAKIYASIGNYARGIALYEYIGAKDKAQALAEKFAAVAPEQAAALPSIEELTGGAYIDERQVVDAIVAYLRAGRVAEAAKIYGACREDLGYPVITAVAGQRDIELGLAKVFYAARDYHKAAQVLENMEQFDKAAALYERSDDFARAADAYVKTGNRLKAAQMYERSGNHEQAGELYLAEQVLDRAAVSFERALSYFRAGQLFFSLGQYDKALQLLQKIQPDDNDYLDACSMVGQVLHRGGYLDLAVKRYEQALREQQVDERSAPLFRHWGILLRDKGDTQGAREVLERVLTWKLDYEDVRQIVGGLGAAVAAPVKAAAAVAPAAQSGAPLVSMMDGFEFLRDAPLFGELSLDEIRVLYHMAQTRTLRAGEVLIEQDQPGRALYIVRDGQVVVSRVGDGGAKTLAELGPGSPVGEMSLFDDQPTSARVAAKGDVTVFEITKDRFQKLIDGSDKLAVKIYRVFVQTLVQRLRQTTQR